MSTVLDVSSVADRVDQDESIFEILTKAAHEGDIERLYEVIKEDGYILSRFDKIPFCQTPLHTAAENGQTHFAMEVMNLKPSFAMKLNASGYSPIHLALQNNHTRLVRALVAVDSRLVRIKGRESITPLHYVARIGDVDLVSEFLVAFPSCLEDVTSKCESVVHLAVKNHQFMTFKVLLGWIRRANKEDILDLKDEDGNTVLHIAAAINQTEVMKLLRHTVKVTAKNLDGKTAMDILEIHQSPCLPGAKRFVEIAKEKLVCRSTMTLAEYLSKDLSFIEKQNALLGRQRNISVNGNGSRNTSSRYDITLVVAILVATATLAAGLCPPGGFWQESGHNYYAGQMIMPFKFAFSFIGLTGFAFLLSLYVILILIIGHPMWKLIYGSTAALGVAISVSYAIIFPNPDSERSFIMSIVFVCAFPLTIVTMLLAIFMHSLLTNVAGNKWTSLRAASAYLRSRDSYISWNQYSAFQRSS